MIWLKRNLTSRKSRKEPVHHVVASWRSKKAATSVMAVGGEDVHET